MPLNLPLMRNNITREDLDAVIEFLKREDPMLTQSTNVQSFEEEWSEWLGVRYSVFVNSGSSANFATMAVLRRLCGAGEVIVPAAGDEAAGGAGASPAAAMGPPCWGSNASVRMRRFVDSRTPVSYTHLPLPTN